MTTHMNDDARVALVDNLTASASRCIRWTKELEAEINERNRLIHAARQSGMSLRQIGDAAGLSHAGIARILKQP